MFPRASIVSSRIALKVSGVEAFYACLLACVLAVSACAPPPDRDLVTYAAPAKPTHLNPLAPFHAGDTLALTLLQDTLLVAGPNGDYVPRLAQEWTVSEDARTYTFVLRPGLKWSDGVAFTAADVVFTLNLFAHPETRSPQGRRLAAVEGYQALQAGVADRLSGVTAAGDRVAITLAAPDAGFLAVLAAGMYLFVLPEHILGGADPAKIMTNPWWLKQDVGMGPFVLSSYEPDRRLDVVRNPHFRDVVSFGRLRLVFTTPEVAAGQVGIGEVDVAPVGAVDAGVLARRAGVRVEQVESAGFERLAVNLRQSYLLDVRVRRALLHALDRPGMIRAALDEHGAVSNSAFMTDWALPQHLATYPYDPAEARRLLAEAGWDPARELLIRYRPGQPERAIVLDVVSENLRAAGVRTRLVPDPDNAGLRTGQWDLLLYGGGVYPVDPATAGPILMCDQVYPAGGNVPGFCDPEFDRLMRAGAATRDPAVRAEAYRAAAVIENAGLPYLWIGRPRMLIGVRDRVRGFAPWGDPALHLAGVAQWQVG